MEISKNVTLEFYLTAMKFGLSIKRMYRVSLGMVLQILIMVDL